MNLHPDTDMPYENRNTFLKPGLAVAAMLILLAMNAAVSALSRGHAWSLLAVAPLSLAQAALLVFALMDLPEAGPVPRVYLGMAIILLAVAALSLADYATRAGALDDDPMQAPATGGGGGGGDGDGAMDGDGEGR
jgi:hypothetical protein